MKRITAYVLALVLTCFCVSSVAGAYYADVPAAARWQAKWKRPCAMA